MSSSTEPLLELPHDESRIAMLGPSKAGKTIYLAAICHASFAYDDRRRMIHIRPVAGNVDSENLMRDAARVINGDTLPATSHYARYELVADLPGSRFFDLGAESLELSLLDPPGGDCLPTSNLTISGELLAEYAQADRLLLLFPAERRALPTDLDQRIRKFRLAVQQAKGLTERQPCFSRISVALTMSELLVEPNKANAVNRLDEFDPKLVISTLLGQAVMDEITRLAPRGGDGYSLVSAFGFDRASGRAAAERTAEGWKIKQRSTVAFDGTSSVELNEDWWPYRLFEPLEYLARGFVWREGIQR